MQVTHGTLLDCWVPKLEAAQEWPLRISRGLFQRSIDLWTEARLASTHPRAAIIVRGRLARRKSWTHDEELSASTLARLESDEARAPELVSQRRAQLRSAATQIRCTGCPIRMGYGPCARCCGTGTSNEFDQSGDRIVTKPCTECADGFTRCAVCEGKGTSFRARVEYWEDRVESFNSVVVPDDVEAHAAAIVRARLAAVTELPASLALPLDRDLDAGTAYRGPARQVSISFHGFELGSALESARSTLAEYVGTGDVSAEEHATHAWPFLVLEFEHESERYTAVAMATAGGSTVADLAMHEE